MSTSIDSHRRRLIGAASAMLAMPLLSVPAVAANDKKPLVLAGPPASVSFPFLHMMESNALAEFTDKVDFKLWTNPDQLRALAVDGAVDFIATPSNVAANLYNRGVPLSLLNISVWDMLWLVSRDSSLKTLSDFKGKEIAMPFRADMPDILFTLLAQKQGLDPAKDFRLRYVANPMDAVQLLITRRVDHALLAEPAVSMALRKTQSFPVSIIAPDLYRSVSLQDEWGRVLQREPRIPQAGIVALGRARQDQALLEHVQQAYETSLKWCYDNPEDCGSLVASRIDMFIPEAVSDAMRASVRHFASAQQAKPELEYFYQMLLERQPGLVGGKLPDKDFYA